MSDYQLAEELHKPVVRKFKRKKVYSRFKDNVHAAELAVIESLSSNNQILNIVVLHSCL